MHDLNTFVHLCIQIGEIVQIVLIEVPVIIGGSIVCMQSFSWPGLKPLGRPYLIDFMFRGSGGSDFCSLQKKKKKWARSCACVRAPNCVVVTQLCSRKKINDIHGDFNDIHAFFFFFYPPPGSQFSLGNP